jgi:hypothetical protein
MTTTTLSRRQTMHLSSGGPKMHAETTHNDKLTREILVSNTKIVRKEQNFNRLQLLESLMIQERKPLINNQTTGSHRTLKLN